MRVSARARARKFMGPAVTAEMLRDPQHGMKASRAMTAKLPRVFHLLMRVNRQTFAMFQMQYGLTPTMRYEYMKLMTRSALLGLRFDDERAGELPDPANLHTATTDFFEREVPLVARQMEREFFWAFPDVFVEQSGGSLLKARMRKRATAKPPAARPEETKEAPQTPLRL